MLKTSIIRIGFLFGLVLPFLPAWSSPGDENHNKAYNHNRQGMISMSMARFGEAVEDFQKAASLAVDYEIRGEKLQYTPLFHAGWASEKMGDREGACDAYQKFLEVAPAELAEASKVDHANIFIGKNCRVESRP